jgi:hypothetical protein
MTVFGASVNLQAQLHRLPFPADYRFDNLVQGNIIPLTGNIITETDMSTAASLTGVVLIFISRA